MDKDNEYNIPLPFISNLFTLNNPEKQTSDRNEKQL